MSFESKLSINLFPHQVRSVEEMESMEITNRIDNSLRNVSVDTKIGIFNDPPVSGKDISMVSLVARDKRQWDVNKTEVKNSISDYLNDMFVIYDLTVTLTPLKETLIITNCNEVEQWNDYFSLTSLKVTKIKTKAECSKFKLGEQDVIIISSTMYNHFVKEVVKERNFIWKRFIYDHPVQNKISKMESVNAGFYWFIQPDLSSFSTVTFSGFLSRIFYKLNSLSLRQLFSIKNSDTTISRSFKPQIPLETHVRNKINTENMLLNFIKDRNSPMITCENGKMKLSDCSICLEEMKNASILECNHIFCKDCIARCCSESGKKCPYCRLSINTNSIVSLDDFMLEPIDKTIDSFIKMHISDENRKFLIISNTLLDIQTPFINIDSLSKKERMKLQGKVFLVSKKSISSIEKFDGITDIISTSISSVENTRTIFKAVRKISGFNVNTDLKVHKFY